MNHKLSFLIKQDALRYNKHVIPLYVYFTRPEFRYVFWLRCLSSYKTNIFLKYTICIPIYMLLRHYEWKYGIHINSNIPIGLGLMVVHGGSVYVNVSQIGDNFTVYQDVTLGTSIGHEVPEIGNNVRVYAGAKVLGHIKLGDNVIVAANAVVTKSVEEGTVVMGVPAKPKYLRQ